MAPYEQLAPSREEANTTMARQIHEFLHVVVVVVEALIRLECWVPFCDSGVYCTRQYISHWEPTPCVPYGGSRGETGFAYLSLDTMPANHGMYARIA